MPKPSKSRVHGQRESWIIIAPLGLLLTSHTGFPEFLNAYLLSPTMRQAYKGRIEQLQSIRRICVTLARAVEQLAPAVDRDAHPENAEYPWQIGDDIVVPIHYSFPNLSLLLEPRGRTFLNFIEQAFDEYTGNA